MRNRRPYKRQRMLCGWQESPTPTSPCQNGATGPSCRAICCRNSRQTSPKPYSCSQRWISRTRLQQSLRPMRPACGEHANSYNANWHQTLISPVTSSEDGTNCRSIPRMTDKNLERYARQICYAPLGEAGQRQMLESRVLICGCGALGSVIANTLVRAGVGHVRIVDRDFLELNNLQRQVIYNERDVEARLPKAIAAAIGFARLTRKSTLSPSFPMLTSQIFSN